jgi:hypothetical protein
MTNYLPPLTGDPDPDTPLTQLTPEQLARVKKLLTRLNPVLKLVTIEEIYSYWMEKFIERGKANDN